MNPTNRFFSCYDYNIVSIIFQGTVGFTNIYELAYNNSVWQTGKRQKLENFVVCFLTPPAFPGGPGLGFMCAQITL